jgi:hypothetical protein
VTVFRASSVASNAAREASVARRSRPKKSNWNTASEVRDRKLDFVLEVLFLSAAEVTIRLRLRE